MTPPPASILVLHAGALGDFVLTTHVVRLLRSVYPRAKVAVAARSSLAPWFAEHQVYDRAYDVDALRLHALFRDDADLPDDSPVHEFDLIVNFLAGPDATISRNLSRRTNARGVAVDPCLRQETAKAGRHITSQWIDDLAGEGLRLPDGVASEPLTPRIHEAITRADSTRLICHPGGGGRAKCAPLEHFESIVRHARNEAMDVSWMIGPTEREWYGQGYVDRLARMAPVIEEHEIGAAADRLGEATTFVGNDAGITHLAAGIGLRTCVFFASTDPRIWHPLGPRVVVRRVGECPR